MAHFFTVLGRLTGLAIKSQAFDRAITLAAGYVISEMRLADLRAKRVLLRRKLTNHLRLLGKTVYHLIENEMDPIKDNNVLTIIRVLGEIEMEITVVGEELERRRRMEEERKKKSGNGRN